MYTHTYICIYICIHAYVYIHIRYTSIQKISVYMYIRYINTCMSDIGCTKCLDQVFLNRACVLWHGSHSLSISVDHHYPRPNRLDRTSGELKLLRFTASRFQMRRKHQSIAAPHSSCTKGTRLARPAAEI